MYVINNLGKKEDSSLRKNGRKRLISGLLNYCFIILLMYMGMNESFLFFLMSYLLTTILFLVFFVAIPIIQYKRHNRTIKMIEFHNNDIIYDVFPALWFKNNKIQVNKNKVKVGKRIVTWYGNGLNEGYVLTSNNKEYYLVFDFFDEIEEIKRELS